MGNFSVVANTDGNFTIHSEHGDADSAIMEWHAYCRSVRNDKTCKKATIKILDAQLDQYCDYTETIIHTQAAE